MFCIILFIKTSQITPRQQTQTATIEEMTVEIATLKARLVAETEYSARVTAENKQYLGQIAELEETRSSYLSTIAGLKNELLGVSSSEQSLLSAQEKAQKALKQQIHDLKITHASQLENQRFKFTKEMKTMQEKLSNMIEDYAEAKKQLKTYEQNAFSNKNMGEIKFKRPSGDSSTQTVATDDGLWDKADGWILPISKNAVARNQWRRAMNFAHCKSCKGGIYLIMLYYRCAYSLTYHTTML